jgi:hypothetical protein
VVDIEVIYHFVLVAETEIRVVKTIEKGNRFERLFLPALMLKTEKSAEYMECIESPSQPKNRIEVTENRIELWIYGSIPYVQTSESRVAFY